MKKLFKIASVFLFLASFIGCKPELELEPTVKTGSIEGKVVYENENVTDYSKIQVSLISTNGLMAASYCEARGIATNARKIEDIMYTDCWGKYSFENVPEGVYTICASSDSSTKKAVLTNVVVTAGRTVTASDLGLTATGAVSGRITIDLYTEGVLGLDVFIAGTSFDGKVGIDGSFELTGIPAKYDYVLCVQKGDYVTIIDDKLAVYGNETTIVPSFNISSENMKENQNNTTFRWRGSFDVAPYDPQLYDAYFNSMDGCSYIWNGSNWDLLARAGNDGEDGVDGNSIRWRGSYVSSEYIYDPQYLDAYYNETDGCSYIWNGSSWDLLAQKGENGLDGINGLPIRWQGEFSFSPNYPELNWAYYNTSDGCSYIYNGYTWELLAHAGNDGLNGSSINWLGSFESSDYIEDPQSLDVYYNETDGCSYLYFNGGWGLLAKSGNSINWRGSYEHPNYVNTPQYLDVYFNTNDGCSYIYINEGWELIAQRGNGITWRGNYESAEYIEEPQYLDLYYNTFDGCSYIYSYYGLWEEFTQNGKGINWRGSYEGSEYIEAPQYLDAYFNETDGCSYIYNYYGEWELFAQKGDKGDKGNDGITIKWCGSYANSSEIENPQFLWAYYNITDGCSYIYNGNEWELLARKGTDGATGSGEGGIRWLGSFYYSSEIVNPVALDAYFNITDGSSYIYNGTEWMLLAKAGEDGINGIDGKSITWRGSKTCHEEIFNPKEMDAYWNTTENCAYIYTGYSWYVLVKGPASGGTGSNSNTNIGSEVGANVVGTTLISWDSPEGVIRIPNGVTDIAEDVFNNKDKITRVIIPSSVVNIGKSVFYDCDGLTSVEFLGNGLEIIGASAFYDCSNLATITLPNTLTSIGSSAFQGCKKITSVNIPDSVIRLGGSAYNSCSMLRNLSIGNGITNLEEYTFCDCDALTSVIIQNTVKTISVRLFVGCDSLVELVIDGTWCINNGEAQKISIADLKRDSYTDGYYDYTWTRVTN